MNKTIANLMDSCGIGNFLRPVLRCLREQRNLLNRIPMLVRRRAQINKYLAATEIRMLQLGASDKSLMGWLNSDLDPVCFKDIFLDATKRFPLPNSTIDFVFSEHFFEHIDRLEGEHCAKEVYRCLKPGGVMRLATPNLQRYIGLFRSDLDPSEADHLNRFKDKFRLSSISPCLALNHLMYNWGHRFLYNESELIAMLKAAGFQTIKSVAVGKSSYPQLSDLEQHWKFYGKEMNDFETMVFEATK